MNAATRSRKNRAPLNLTMGWLGLAAILILIAQHAITLPEWLRLLSAFVIIAAIPTMFFTRKSDEYTLQLWSAGANAAFGASLFFFLFLGAMQGLSDGLTGSGRSYQDFSVYAFDLILLAFFLTFNIKRLTGAM